VPWSCGSTEIWFLNRVHLCVGHIPRLKAFQIFLHRVRAAPGFLVHLSLFSFISIYGIIVAIGRNQISLYFANKSLDFGAICRGDARIFSRVAVEESGVDAVLACCWETTLPPGLFVAQLCVLGAPLVASRAAFVGARGPEFRFQRPAVH